MLTLPPDLEAGIAEALRLLPSSQWQAAARNLSQRYREREAVVRRNRGADASATRTPQAQIRNAHEALGYAGLVLPAAYAQVWGAMEAAQLRAPSFEPVSMLDLGTGPGTALWAAVDHWPTINSIDAWERETAFVELGSRLTKGADHPAVKGARWRQITLTGALPQGLPKYDLIVIGHVLNEMNPETRDAIVLSAWERCAGMLLVVEPGTSAAFPVVLRARELMIEQGAHTIAPCPHNALCPLPTALPLDWCHYPQRLQRPGFQRIAREGTAGWEEAKFSYAAMARFEQESPIYARLLHDPHVSKIGADLTLSTAKQEIERRHISRRDKPQFKSATDLRWGDVIHDS